MKNIQFLSSSFKHVVGFSFTPKVFCCPFVGAELNACCFWDRSTIEPEILMQKHIQGKRKQLGNLS